MRFNPPRCWERFERGLVGYFRVIKAARGRKALGKALSASVINQILTSTSSFIFGVYLVRALAADEFGLYGVGFALSLFIVGLGNAIFLTQMVVHTPDKPPEERMVYAGKMFVLVLLFCLLVAIGLPGIGALVFNFLSTEYAIGLKLVIAVSLASPAILVKEYFVRHAYNNKREPEALVINLVALGVLIFLLALTEVLGYSLSAHTALMLYALPQAVAATAGFLRAKLPISLVAKNNVTHELKEAWIHGKWAVVQNVLSLLRMQAHVFLGMLFVGPAAVGVINATRILVSPVLFILPAVSQILMPRLASMRDDVHRAIKITKLAAGVLVLSSLLYALFLFVFSQEVVGLVLGKDYLNNVYLANLILFWCGVMCVQVAQTCFSTLAQSLKMFRNWVYGNGIAAIVTVVFGVVLVNTMDLSGLVLGVLVGEVVLFLVIVKDIRRQAVRSALQYGH